MSSGADPTSIHARLPQHPPPHIYFQLWPQQMHCFQEYTTEAVQKRIYPAKSKTSTEIKVLTALMVAANCKRNAAIADA